MLNSGSKQFPWGILWQELFDPRHVASPSEAPRAAAACAAQLQSALSMLQATPPFIVEAFKILEEAAPCLKSACFEPFVRPVSDVLGPHFLTFLDTLSDIYLIAPRDQRAGKRRLRFHADLCLRFIDRLGAGVVERVEEASRALPSATGPGSPLDVLREGALLPAKASPPPYEAVVPKGFPVMAIDALKCVANRHVGAFNDSCLLYSNQCSIFADSVNVPAVLEPRKTEIPLPRHARKPALDPTPMPSPVVLQRNQDALHGILRRTQILLPLLRSALHVDSFSLPDPDTPSAHVIVNQYVTLIAGVFESVRSLVSIMWPIDPVPMPSPSATAGHQHKKTKGSKAASPEPIPESRALEMEWAVAAMDLVGRILHLQADPTPSHPETKAQAPQADSHSFTVSASDNIKLSPVQSRDPHTVYRECAIREALVSVFFRCCAAELVLGFFRSALLDGSSGDNSPPAETAAQSIRAFSFSVGALEALRDVLSHPPPWGSSPSWKSLYIVLPEDAQLARGFMSTVTCVVQRAVYQRPELFPGDTDSPSGQPPENSLSPAIVANFAAHRQRLFEICLDLPYCGCWTSSDDTPYFAQCAVYYIALHAGFAVSPDNPGVVALDQGAWTTSRISGVSSVLQLMLAPFTLPGAGAPSEEESQIWSRFLPSFLRCAATLPLPDAAPSAGSQSSTGSLPLPAASTSASLTDAIDLHCPFSVTTLFLNLLISRAKQLPEVDEGMIVLAIELASRRAETDTAAILGIRMQLIGALLARGGPAIRSLHAPLGSYLGRLLQRIDTKIVDSETFLTFVERAAESASEGSGLAMALWPPAARLLELTNEPAVRQRAFRILCSLPFPSDDCEGLGNTQCTVSIPSAGAAVTPTLTAALFTLISPDEVQDPKLRARAYSALLDFGARVIAAGPSPHQQQGAYCESAAVASVAAALVRLSKGSSAKSPSRSSTPSGPLVTAASAIFDVVEAAGAAAAEHSPFNDLYYANLAPLCSGSQRKGRNAPDPTQIVDFAVSGTASTAAPSPEAPSLDTSFRLLIAFFCELERQLQAQRPTPRHPSSVQDVFQAAVQKMDAARVHVLAVAFAVFHSSSAMSPPGSPLTMTATSAMAAATVARHGLQRLADIRSFVNRGGASLAGVNTWNIWWTVEKIASCAAVAVVHLDSDVGAEYSIEAITALVQRIFLPLQAAADPSSPSNVASGQDLAYKRLQQCLKAIQLTSCSSYESAVELLLPLLTDQSFTASMQRLELQLALDCAIHCVIAAKPDTAPGTLRKIEVAMAALSRLEERAAWPLDAAHLMDRREFLINEVLPGFAAPSDASVGCFWPGLTYRLIRRACALATLARGTTCATDKVGEYSTHSSEMLSGWGPPLGTDLPALLQWEQRAAAGYCGNRESSECAALLAATSTDTRSTCTLLHRLALLHRTEAERTGSPSGTDASANRDAAALRVGPYFARCDVRRQWDAFAIMFAAARTGNAELTRHLVGTAILGPAPTDSDALKAAVIRSQVAKLGADNNSGVLDAAVLSLVRCLPMAKAARSFASLAEKHLVEFSVSELLQHPGLPLVSVVSTFAPAACNPLVNRVADALSEKVQVPSEDSAFLSFTVARDGMPAACFRVLQSLALLLWDSSPVGRECYLRLAAWCGAAFATEKASARPAASASLLLRRGVQFLTTALSRGASSPTQTLDDYRGTLMGVTYLLAMGKDEFSTLSLPSLLSTLESDVPPSCWRGVAPQLASLLPIAAHPVRTGFAKLLASVIIEDGSDSPLIYLLAGVLADGLLGPTADATPVRASSSRALRENVLQQLPPSLQRTIARTAEFVVALKKLGVFPFENALRLLHAEHHSLGWISDVCPPPQCTPQPQQVARLGAMQALPFQWLQDYLLSSINSVRRALAAILAPVQVTTDADQESSPLFVRTSLSVVERQFYENFSDRLSDFQTVVDEHATAIESQKAALPTDELVKMLQRILDIRDRLFQLRANLINYDAQFIGSLAEDQHPHGLRMGTAPIASAVPQLLTVLAQENAVPGTKIALPQSAGLSRRTTSAARSPGVAQVAPNFQMLHTRAKPRQLALIAEDGTTHPYLLKGREDELIDTRVLQLYDLINLLLDTDPQARARQQQLGTYHVVPLGFRCCLVKVLPAVVPVISLHGKWHEEMHSSGASPPASPTKIQKRRYFPTERFFSTMRKVTGDHQIHNKPRIEWKLEDIKRSVIDLMRSSPRDLLARALWLSPAPVDLSLGSAAASGVPSSSTVVDPFGLFSWYRRVRTYTISLATASAVGFIIGLGDRHLGNILIDLTRGNIVHVDHTVCFDRGLRLPVPEKVPFRMTPVLQAALGPHGVEGNFTGTLAATLDLLRSSRVPTLQLLNTFVHDPLWDWAREVKPVSSSSIEDTSTFLQRITQTLDTNIDLQLEEFISLVESVKASPACAQMDQVSKEQSALESALQESSAAERQHQELLSERARIAQDLAALHYDMEQALDLRPHVFERVENLELLRDTVSHKVADVEARCREINLRVQNATMTVVVARSALLKLPAINPNAFRRIAELWSILLEKGFTPVRQLLEDQFFSHCQIHPTVAREAAALADSIAQLANLGNILREEGPECLSASGESWTRLYQAIDSAPVTARSLRVNVSHLLVAGRSIGADFPMIAMENAESDGRHGAAKREFSAARAVSADAAVEQARRLIGGVAERLSFAESPREVAVAQIQRAISIDNLAVMFEGWAPWL